MIERQAVEAELRRTSAGSFDYMTQHDQEALVATRTRELEQQQQPSEKPVFPKREREARAPAPRQLPAATVPERELRRQLKQATAEYKHNIQLVAEARIHTERASERLAMAQSELHKFDELDERVAAWEVQAVREGLESGDMPHALASGLRARSVARDRCDRALAAHATLVREQHAAEAKLLDAKRTVDRACEDIAIAQARMIARALADAEAEVAAMRVDICSLQLPGVTLPRDLLDAAFAPLPQIQAGAAATQRWQAFMKRLRSDPEAKFHADDEPTV